MLFRSNNIIISSRNLENISVTACKFLTPIMLMKFNNIFLTLESIRFFEEFLNEKNK